MSEYVADTHALLWLQNQMPLLTRDQAIQAAQVVETIWD